MLATTIINWIHSHDHPKAGFGSVRFDGKIYTLEDLEDMEIDKQKKHSVEIIIDKSGVGRYAYCAGIPGSIIDIDSTAVKSIPLEQKWRTINLWLFGKGAVFNGWGGISKIKPAAIIRVWTGAVTILYRKAFYGC